VGLLTTTHESVGRTAGDAHLHFCAVPDLFAAALGLVGSELEAFDQELFGELVIAGKAVRSGFVGCFGNDGLEHFYHGHFGGFGAHGRRWGWVVGVVGRFDANDRLIFGK
jgi:hypothetical protein